MTSSGAAESREEALVAGNQPRDRRWVRIGVECIPFGRPAKDDAVAEGRGLAERDQQALAGEMADLVYHLLVLAAERGLAPSRVMGVLQERHGA